MRVGMERIKKNVEKEGVFLLFPHHLEQYLLGPKSPY
jgi:hypothetical protein